MKTQTRRQLIWSAATAMATSKAIASTAKLRVAISGLQGHYNEVRKATKHLPGMEVVAVAMRSTTDEQRLKAAGALVADAQKFDSHEAMLDAVKPDFVCICDENHERADAVIAALERGIPTAAEKPMALSMAGLERVRNVQAKTNTPLTMLLPMRFDAPYMTMRKVVDDGLIGETVALSGQKSYRLGERPEWMKSRETFGGAAPYIGCHLVDLLRFVSGRDMVATSAFGSNVGFPQTRDMENNVAIAYRLDNGGSASLRLDYLRPEAALSHGDDRLRVAGTKGVVEHQAGEVTLITTSEAPHVVAQAKPHLPLFADFVAHVREGNPPHLTLDECLRVTEIVLRTREAQDSASVVTI